jgi:hypothetical protein
MLTRIRLPDTIQSLQCRSARESHSPDGGVRSTLAPLFAEEAAVVHPAKDGTTYVVVGSGGRPRYDWSGAVEGDRNFIAGVDTGKPARPRR